MTTTQHPTIRDTLAELRAKHARALSPPVPSPDRPTAPMRPAQDVSTPPPRPNARSVPHRSQDVRWATICRVLAERGPMTAAQLAPLIGLCLQYIGKNLYRMRLAGLVAVAAKVASAECGRPTYHYDLAERVSGTVADAAPKWAPAVVAMAVERRTITHRDMVERGLAVCRATANRRLRALAKPGLLELVAVNKQVRGNPTRIYGPAPQ